MKARKLFCLIFRLETDELSFFILFVVFGCSCAWEAIHLLVSRGIS